MGTMAIEAVLKAARHAAVQNDEIDGVREALDTADAELEAIRKAARDAVEHNKGRSINHAPASLWDLLESIAKEET